ncbi:hypothetical protein BH11MYX4_BH11MYX4_05060 [soil metagenome]
MKTRVAAPLFALASLSLGLGMATAAAVTACSDSSVSTVDSGGGGPVIGGQLMLVISSDLVWGKDLDRIDVEISHHGRVQFTSKIAAPATLPATVSVDVPAGDADPVSIHLIGSKGSNARIVRDAVTTVPGSRGALLRLPLDWLCVGFAGASACGAGTTCVVGACTDAIVNSAALDDLPANYLDTLPACFNAPACFANAVEPAVNPTTCSFPSTGATENVALVTTSSETSAGDGACIGDHCYIVLAHTFSWHTSGPNIVLPPAVCDRVLKGDVKIAHSSTCDKAREVDQAICRPQDLGDSGPPVGPQLIGTVVPATNGNFSALGGIAVDDKYVYVAGPAPVGIQRLPKAGGALTSVSPTGALQIVVDGTEAFFAGEVDLGQQAQPIYRLDLTQAGAAPTVLFSVFDPGNFNSSLCVTPSRVFGFHQEAGTTWGAKHKARGGAASAAFAALPVQPLFGAPHFGACKADTVHWVDGNGDGDGGGSDVSLRSFDVVSSAVDATLLSSKLVGVDNGGPLFAPGAFFVELTDSNSGAPRTRALYRGTTGGTTTSFVDLGVQPSFGSRYQLLMRADRLYALQQDDSVGAIFAVPVGSGAKLQIATAPRIIAMTADDEYLYYVTIEMQTPTGRIYRVKHK